jgi:hypothetical protein
MLVLLVVMQPRSWLAPTVSATGKDLLLGGFLLHMCPLFHSRYDQLFSVLVQGLEKDIPP